MKKLKKIDGARRHELWIYLIIWTIVFIVPLLSRLVESIGEARSFDWTMVFRAWGELLPFFLLFWLHDLFIAPFLLRNKRHKVYFSLFFAVIILFTLATCSIKSYTTDNRSPHRQPNALHIHPATPNKDNVPPPPREPQYDFDGREGGEPRETELKGGEPKGGEPKDNERGGYPLSPLTPYVLFNLALAVAMCGLNIGVKLYFKSIGDEAKRQNMEKQQLQHELEYLKYQINPHFFMNTLNNIHALIDIDAERAKQAIIELSVLMRYTLYEGAAVKVPLAKEISFAEHYVALMRLRFTGKVNISTDFPQQSLRGNVPPLIFATFIENAFKHGISYRHKSYVKVSVSIDDEHIVFDCQNSLRPSAEDAIANQQTVDGKRVKRRKGIGLINVRKRLALIYANNYELNIRHDEQNFYVHLSLPIE